MKTMDKTYNGWANYETWNVKLWLDNDQGCEAPDFEQEFEADSKEEVIEMLVKKGWDRQLVEKFTMLWEG